MKLPSRRTCLWAAAALALIAYAPYLYWAKVEYRLLTVDGKLYRSAAMPPEKLLDVVDELGIKTVIDLRTPGPEVDAENAVLTNAGIEHLNLPSGTTPDPHEWEPVLEVMKNRNEPILFH
nr:dual specificity protein phosphatase family protein [Akkermansiaceae bacterium]